MYNAKNYTEQGGDKTVIGGTLEIKDGAIVTGITGVAGAAAATVLGGVKAATKGAGDTVEVKIDAETSKLYVAPAAVATTTAAGIVKQAEYVADAEDSVTVEKFNALLAALIEAGIMTAGA